MDSPLGNLGLQIKEHWKQYRPEDVRPAPARGEA